jgi:hypothetical protein
LDHSIRLDPEARKRSNAGGTTQKPGGTGRPAAIILPD